MRIFKIHTITGVPAGIIYYPRATRIQFGDIHLIGLSKGANWTGCPILSGVSPSNCLCFSCVAQARRIEVLSIKKVRIDLIKVIEMRFGCNEFAASSAACESDECLLINTSLFKGIQRKKANSSEGSESPGAKLNQRSIYFIYSADSQVRDSRFN